MYSSVNTIWVLFGTALVFFMQAGFSLCEAGFTRAKNTGNILMKNLPECRCSNAEIHQVFHQNIYDDISR